MDVDFANPDLERLDTEPGFNGGYAPEAVKGFKKVLRFIKSAADERDFRSMRSLNYEKLKGDRSHQHSLRLNRQWRLIVELTEGNPKNTVRIVGIEDYH